MGTLTLAREPVGIVTSRVSAFPSFFQPDAITRRDEPGEDFAHEFAEPAQPRGAGVPRRRAAGADRIAPLPADAPRLLDRVLPPDGLVAFFDDPQNRRVSEGKTHVGGDRNR